MVLATPEGEQIKGIILDEKTKEFVVVLPWQVHTILNPGDRECVLLIIVNEAFDPDDADTYRPEK